MVTQTEQTPVVSQSLPRGLRYVTPAGPPRDPAVVDWRNLLHRLATAKPCHTLAPAVDRLRVGGHLLVVNPEGAVGARGSPWARRVNGQISAVNAVARHDPRLRLIGTFRTHVRPQPYAGVTGRLFTKTSDGVGPCTARAALG